MTAQYIDNIFRCREITVCVQVMEQKPKLNRRHTVAQYNCRIIGVSALHFLEFQLFGLTGTGYIRIKHAYCDPVIGKHPLNLLLHFIKRLFSEIARFAGIFVAVQTLEVGKIKPLGSTFANNGDGGILYFALFDFSCHSSIIKGH